MYRSECSLFFVLLKLILIISAERVNLPDDDLYYFDPNKYVSSNNQYVQEVLRKYNQDPHYTNNNPLSAINQDLLNKLASTPDPRLIDSSNYPNQRNSRPRTNERVDVLNVGQGRHQNQNYGPPYNIDQNRNQYDVYPSASRGDPPRQYFENDPQYSLRDDELFKLLAQLDIRASQQCNINVRAQWDFETNVNDANQIRAVRSLYFYF